MQSAEDLLALATPEELAELGGFDTPSAEQSRYLTRELGWGDQLRGLDANAAAGECAVDMYSLKEAAKFFRFGTAGLGFSKGGSGSVSVANVDNLLKWIQETIGDTSLSAALTRDLESLTSYNAKVQVISRLLNMRYAQLAALAQG